MPRSYGEQTALIGAPLLGRGFMAVMTLTGAVDTLAFDAYLARATSMRNRGLLPLGALPRGEMLCSWSPIITVMCSKLCPAIQ